MPATHRVERIRSALYTHRYLVIAQLILILPALYTLITGGPRGPGGSRGAFAYLSGDALYYFVVARHIVELGAVTFDQAHPTNGFHPLWQALAAVLYWPFAHAEPPAEAYLVLAFLVSLILLSAALAVVYSVLHRAYGRVGVLFLLLPAGAYAIAGAFFLPLPYGALQSFANGMESGVLLLSYALFLGAFIQYMRGPSAGWAMAAGALLGAVALSRLDHALLAVVAVPAMALRGMHTPLRWAFARHAIAAGMVAAAMLGLYLLWSRIYVGSWLPVSGVVKTGATGAVLRANLDAIGQAASAFWSGMDPHRRDPYFWRGVQLLGPLSVALAYLAATGVHAHFRRAGVAPLTLALWITAVMTVGLASYNLAFVTLIHQGEWYMPVGILFVTLAAYDCAERFTPAWLRGVRPMRYAALTLLLAANGFVLLGLTDIRNDHVHINLHREVAEAARHYQGQDIRMVEFSDGIFAYGTRFPVMSGQLFTADPAAIRQFRAGEQTVLEIAFERGYRFVPVITRTSGGFRYGMTPEEVLNRLPLESGILAASYLPYRWHLPPFDFTVDYIGEEGRFVVLQMAPREETGEPQDGV